MTAVDIAIAMLALFLTAAVSIDLAAPAVAEYLRQRRIVRQSALDSQMQAMEAARQLSVMAWQARHQMYRLGDEMRDSDSVHSRHSKPTRSK